MASKDIFISYRRDNASETANLLHQLLINDGYSACLDTRDFRGRFDRDILSHIDEATDFILLVSKGAFNHSLNPFLSKEHDWMRVELSRAIKQKKNIIPILLDGVKRFPIWLPSDIKEVKLFTGRKIEGPFDCDNYKKIIPLLKSNPHTISSIANIDELYYICFEIGFDTAGQITLYKMGDNSKNSNLKSNLNVVGLSLEDITGQDGAINIDLFSEAIKQRYSEECLYFFNIGLNLFMLSYLKNQTPKSGSESFWKDQIKEFEGRIHRNFLHVGVPMIIMNQLESINSPDGTVQYRRKLGTYFKNQSKCVKTCRVCGSKLGSDYTSCPTCNTDIQ